MERSHPSWRKTEEALRLVQRASPPALRLLHLLSFLDTSRIRLRFLHRAYNSSFDPLIDSLGFRNLWSICISLSRPPSSAQFDKYIALLQHRSLIRVHNGCVQVSREARLFIRQSVDLRSQQRYCRAAFGLVERLLAVEVESPPVDELVLRHVEDVSSTLTQLFGAPESHDANLALSVRQVLSHIRRSNAINGQGDAHTSPLPQASSSPQQDSSVALVEPLIKLEDMEEDNGEGESHAASSSAMDPTMWIHNSGL